MIIYMMHIFAVIKLYTAREMIQVAILINRKLLDFASQFSI